MDHMVLQGGGCSFVTAWKVSVFGVILELFCIFPHLDWLQSECGKTRTRITPNTDTFHAVLCCFECFVLIKVSCRKTNFIYVKNMPEKLACHVKLTYSTTKTHWNWYKMVCHGMLKSLTHIKCWGGDFENFYLLLLNRLCFKSRFNFLPS